MEKFFLVIPLGLEALARHELDVKVPGLTVLSIEKGGITVEAPLGLGFALNQVLKIPSRVLWRLLEFRCRDFPKLFNKVNAFEWEKWFPSPKLNFSVSAKKSRLNNEKRILDTVEVAIERRFKELGKSQENSKSENALYVRAFNDEFTFSFDTTGNALFKRGYKVLEGAAPLRESLAAALYLFTREVVGPFDTVVDPFSGTGTMLLETQSFGWADPSRAVGAKSLQETVSVPQVDFSDSEAPKRYYAFDASADVLQVLQENLANVRSHFDRATGEWTVSVRDILRNEPIDIKGDKKVVMTNPPYGERLQLPLPPREFYPRFLECVEAMDPIAVGFVFPRRLAKFVPRRSAKFRKSHDLPFMNGGIPVVYRVLI